MRSENNDRPSSLFDEFPPVTLEEWESVIRRDLNGADYRDRLAWQTGEGVRVLPFYRREDLPEPLQRPAAGDQRGWTICQSLPAGDVTEANRAARTALQGSADALQIPFRLTEDLRGIDGVGIHNQSNFQQLFEGIDLAQVPMLFDTAIATPLLAGMLANALDRQGAADGRTAGIRLIFDPYAHAARHGRLPKPEEQWLDEAEAMIRFFGKRETGVHCLGIDARSWHESGGTITQEIALALASASEYLAKLADRGLEPYRVAPAMHFLFSTGSSYFPEIAKFRAFRLLWENMLQAYGVAPAEQPPLYLHAESSRRNKAVYDPHTNILRSGTEGMAAALGGCDAITLAPFDRPLRGSGPFSRRLARNSQAILKEEAYLDRVEDPAAGSYYIETLTDKIAAEAWSLFSGIEQQGGILEGIRAGRVAQLISESASQRAKATARGERIFIGINKYPDPEERKAGEMEPQEPISLPRPSGTPAPPDRDRLFDSLRELLEEGSTTSDLAPAFFRPGRQEHPKLSRFRPAEPFEQLRLAAEHHPNTPVAMTLPLGNPRMRKARSAFAANMLGCGGYRIIEPVGFDGVESAMEAVREEIPEIVVLCSSDEEYPQLAGPICRGLEKLENRPLILLAGDPGERRSEFREAGIDLFIHRNTNLLDALEQLHRRLGISLP